MVIAAVCVGTWLAVGQRASVESGSSVAMISGAPAFPVQVLDLRNWSAVRSDEAAPNPSGKRLELHRGLLAVTIYLPMGSQPGKYEIDIASRKSNGAPAFSGVAGIENGNTVLRVEFDLRKLSPGHYSLGIRQPPRKWRYYPFVLY